MAEEQNFTDIIMNTSETVTEDYYFEYPTTCSMDVSSTMGSALKPILLSIVFVLGLTGNSMVLWILIVFIKLKNVSDICLLNLAVSDLMVTLSLPIYAYQSAGHEFVSTILCKTITCIYQVGFYSGVFFVTLMGIDRYLAIVHAVATMRVRTMRNGMAVSIVIWLVAFCSALPEVIFSGTNDEEGSFNCAPNYPGKTWKLFRNFRENIVGLFISLPIMMFCYISILVVLMRSRNSKKQRAMRLILTIALLFGVFWVPYNVVVFLESLQQLNIGNTCENSVRITFAISATETVVLAHCCINPIIYAFVGEKFRKSLKIMFSKVPICGYLCKQQPIHAKNSENETTNTSV
ncbi:C-C chemokine receptor type 8 [Scleropages formosus]|uniref:C-C motif chemokine receptor 8 n=1 Tax=Scleropages formosus TaxID=113540 RepID=A0A8C9R2Z1_SCLFO|nr:C-C chemokine receptor type 8-like [Scleropages formosus]